MARADMDAHFGHPFADRLTVSKMPGHDGIKPLRDACLRHSITHRLQP
jgi:hypothetical protein